MARKRTLCSTRAHYQECPYVHFSTGYGGICNCCITGTEKPVSKAKVHTCASPYGKYIKCATYRKHPYGNDCLNADY